MLRLAALAVLTAVPARAAAPSFESLLNNVRLAVRETRAEQAKAKDARAAQDIVRLASDADRLTWDARRLKDRLQDVRRRAQRAAAAQPARPGRPGQPGQPPRDQDPFLRNDVRQLVWDLQRFGRDADDMLRELARLSREAGKDPQHVEPARRLESSTGWLENETRWLDSEGRWAGMDLRRAGFNFEAWDVERGAADAERAGRELAQGARELSQQVRP